MKGAIFAEPASPTTVHKRREVDGIGEVEKAACVKTVEGVAASEKRGTFNPYGLGEQRRARIKGEGP